MKSFLRGVQAEYKHINWPTQSQVITYTIVVVVISIAVAYYLGLFDWVFSQALQLLVL